MDKELEKRRSWPWKKKNGVQGLEGGTSPPVKLFDEQEVARILEDQVRIDQEQMVDALREAEEKFSEKERTLNENLDTINKKLTSAHSEITIKDGLIKQHIKVAEEAVIGWEKAENEAAAYKLKLDVALQQKSATEDRVKHLDGALKEVMKQVRSGREEQEQRMHETLVRKTQESDKLRAEMESKLAEASHLLGQTRNELIESQAENNALTYALQDRSRILAEVNETKARSETDKKFLQVRLEGIEKENIDLKYEIHVVTKELDARLSEFEHARKASDVASKHYTEALKKITRLEEECNRLRMLLRKKLPGSAAMVRLRQEVDALGKEQGEGKSRRRTSGRSQSGLDHARSQEAAQEAAQEIEHHSLVAKASAEKIVNLEEETRMLKEALAKRNDDLQAARIMCAKTASSLSSVEDELEAFKSAPRSTPIEKASSPDKLASAGSTITDSSLKRSALKRDSFNFELMFDFTEMERLAHSQSRPQSVAVSDHAVEIACVHDFDASQYQLRISGLEETLAVKDKDLEEANQMCHELSTKLSVAEEQLTSLQSRNAANEQSVLRLQDRLDRVLESQEEPEMSTTMSDASFMVHTGYAELAMAIRKVIYITEALAQATGTASTLTTSDQSEGDASSNLIVLSRNWQDINLDIAMTKLLLAANKFLENEADILAFFLELRTTLDRIHTISVSTCGDLQKERDTATSEKLALSLELESVKFQLFRLEEELSRTGAERDDLDRRMQLELGRFTKLEADISHFKLEKSEMESNLSEMDQHLVEANVRVEALRLQLGEAEALVTELQSQQSVHDLERKEEDLIDQELLELSSSNAGLESSIRATDAEMHHLHDKVAVLEVELHNEQRRHQEVVAKLEDLQEQIHRGVGRIEHSAGSLHSKEFEQLQLALLEDDATKSARKDKDIAAAALAECQRTIIALGKQLKVLGCQEPNELALVTTAAPDSIEDLTSRMEFLRSQADSGDAAIPPVATGTNLTWTGGSVRPARQALPGLYYRQNNSGSGCRNGFTTSGLNTTDGQILNFAESDSVVQETSVPSASPTKVLKSVRTIRGPTSLSKTVNGASPKTEGAFDMRSTSSLRRSYPRSPSETSMSSDHSN